MLSLASGLTYRVRGLGRTYSILPSTSSLFVSVISSLFKVLWILPWIPCEYKDKSLDGCPESSGKWSGNVSFWNLPGAKLMSRGCWPGWKDGRQVAEEHKEAVGVRSGLQEVKSHGCHLCRSWKCLLSWQIPMTQTPFPHSIRWPHPPQVPWSYSLLNLS